MERKRWSLTRADWVLPAGLAVLGVVEVLTVDGLPRGPALAAVLVPAALLLGRRRLPLLFATAAVFLMMWVTPIFRVPEDDVTTPLIVAFVGCFSLGRYEPTWWRGAAAVGALDLALIWMNGPVIPALADLLWVACLTFLPWFFGRLVLAHARQSDVLADQGRRLVEEQRHVTEQAVAQERTRVARELHDVLAHSVSVMVVQAGAARALLGHDEEAVDAALARIEESGRAALDETGHLLGLLREPDETDASPQPSADDLVGLVDGFRAAGAQVDLSMEGSTEGLPAALGLSLYRIAEEAMTNALKHGGGSAHVLYRRSPDAVDLQVTSEVGRRLEVTSGGHGLIGMRERVSMFGGSLSTGPTEDGHYVVRARLPIGTAS